MEKESLYIFKLDTQGEKVKFPNADMPAKLGEYTYSSQRMAGTPTLTATLNYPVCLDDEWTKEEFVEFRGERYYVEQVPTSSKDNKSIMYKHELQFVSERIILENVYFMDVVTAGSDTYHSNSTSIKFMGDIHEFVSRLNSSMIKSGIGYSVVIDDNITSESKLVSLDNVYIAEALQSIYTIYELPYYFVGKVCHIGYTEHIISTPLEYMKGLVSIKKTNASYKIVNRVTGVGGSENIPFYYPNVDENGTIERCQNLMPSIYRESGGAERFYNALNDTYKIPDTNDYYSFKNQYTPNSVKEINVDFSDIVPTIEGVTNTSGQLFGEIADVAFDDNDSDEFGTGTENNIFNETDEYVHSYFYIKLHVYNGNYGFNLFEQGLEGDKAVINMTTGNCAACEFEIEVTYKEDEPKRSFNPVLVDSSGNLLPGDFEQKVTSQTSKYVERQQNTSKNEVWIAVKKDNTSFGVVMPNATNHYKPAIGDKFVITGIKMPNVYVIAAEKRLDEALIKYMSENNDEKFTFSVNFSRVFLAENSQLADILNENARMYIKYNNREYLMYVNSFTCKADKNCLYDISVELTDKLSSNVSALRSTITEIAGDIIGSKLSNYGNIDVVAKVAKYFLRKDKEDIAREIITFLKGILLGNFVKGSSGAGIYKDENENWHIEGDYFHIRKKLTAEEVEIQRNSHIGGKLMQTAASMSCIKVEELEDAYRCYMRTEDAEGRVIYNEFKPNDQANVETFNLQRQANGTLGNHFLWRLVTAVGIDYIELSKSICAEGSDIPQVGDEIVQLGYRGTDDSNRQNAQVLAGAGTDSPYIKQYIGINSFTLPAEYTRLKPGDNLFTGVSHVQPGSTGAKNFSDLPEVIQEAADGMSFGKYNLLRNTGFTGDFLSKQLQNDTELDEGSAMFSPPLDHWDIANVVVQDSAVSESGKEAVISSGNLIQTLFYKVMAGESYVLSFKAKGTSLTYSCGGVSKTIELTSEYNRYVEKFTATSTGEIFSITNATCVLCEIQLERGTVVSAWGNSMLDNSSELAYYESLKYLQSAIHDASSTTLGGLNLANIMLVGNYVDGKIKEITGGISGVYNDEDSVFAFGGGDLEAAIRCVVMFKDNPSYQPTDEELAGIAKIVLTHGGRAILNDVILRGYIYALGGRFQGEVIAESGVFKNISTPNKSLEIDEEGNVKGKDFELENVKASGTIEAGSGSKIGNMQILDGGATLGQNSSFINAHMVNIPYNAGVIDYSKTISGSITQFDTYLISNDMVDLFQMKLPSNDDIANSNSKLHGNGHTFRITIAVGNFYTNTSKSIRLVKQGNMDFYNRDGNPIEYLDIKNGMCVMIQGIINIVSSSRKILYSIL